MQDKFWKDRRHNVNFANRRRIELPCASMKRLNGGEVSTILIIVLRVLLAERVSAVIRRLLA